MYKNVASQGIMTMLLSMGLSGCEMLEPKPDYTTVNMKAQVVPNEAITFRCWKYHCNTSLCKSISSRFIYRTRTGDTRLRIRDTSSCLEKRKNEVIQNCSSKNLWDLLVLLRQNNITHKRGVSMKTKVISIGIMVILIVVGLAGCQEKNNGTTNPDREEFLVNTLGGTVSVLDQKVVFTVPAGAVTEQQTFTVKAAENLPSDTNYVPGTAYEFEPDGFQFQHPVRLTIAYDVTKIPSGAQERYLMLAKLASGSWQIINDSSTNTTTHSVTGTIDGFSSFGVVMDSEKVRIVPYAATCTAAGIVVLEARLLGYPAAYEPQYNWTFLGTNGRIVIDPADYSTVTYVANGDAAENGVDTIKLEVGATFADETHAEGTLYVWGKATATVTIAKTTVKIEPEVASCAPGNTIDFTAVVSNPPNYTMKYIWTSPGVNGELVGIDPDKNTVAYKAKNSAIEGGTDTIKVELWTTFVDDYHEKGVTHKWAEATATVTIQTLSFSISPATAQCPPGGDVNFIATIKNAPANYEFSYQWACSCVYGTLQGANHNLMTYTANDAATDGGTDTIKVELWTDFGEGNAFKWAEASATVTIQKLSVSINPAEAECTPGGQKQFTALVQNLPSNYDIEFRWTCSNNNGRIASDSIENTSVWYTADADATNGSIDTITLEVWTTFADTNTSYKWAEATATVHINVAPLTEYSLVNAAGGEPIAPGSYWVMIVVGRGMIDYHSFQARPGETLRLQCYYRGDEELARDVYLKKGTTTTLLVTWDELPTNEEYTPGPPQFDKTFVLD